ELLDMAIFWDFQASLPLGAPPPPARALPLIMLGVALVLIVAALWLWCDPRSANSMARSQLGIRTDNSCTCKRYSLHYTAVSQSHHNRHHSALREVNVVYRGACMVQSGTLTKGRRMQARG